MMRKINDGGWEGGRDAAWARHDGHATPHAPTISVCLPACPPDCLQAWSYPGGMTPEKKAARGRRLAVFVRERILQLGPTFIKLGQARGRVVQGAKISATSPAAAAAALHCLQSPIAPALEGARLPFPPSPPLPPRSSSPPAATSSPPNSPRSCPSCRRALFVLSTMRWLVFGKQGLKLLNGIAGACKTARRRQAARRACPAAPPPLQDRVPAFSADKAEAIIERELGSPVRSPGNGMWCGPARPQGLGCQ